MNIVKANCHRAPIVVIHGAEGRGKTTLAAKFPAPLFLLLERGLPRGITVDAIDGINSFGQIMGALRELYQAKDRVHETLVIDTIDQLEALIHQDVCAENRWANIEAPAFGKGWVACDAGWRQFLRAITALRDQRNMIIVLVAHCTIDRVEDPRAPSYTSYQLRLHRRARGLVMDAADIIGFLADDLRVIGESGGFRERTRASASPTRFLYVEGTPAFAAKNRYAMPGRIEVPKNFDVQTLLHHVQHQGE